MIHPHFVKIQPYGAWTLKNCAYITVDIEKRGRLAWDDTFKKILTIAERLGKPKVCIDVGANIGDSTRWFIDAGYKTYAFEPQPEAFLCLTRNCPEAECFNMPVGNGERVMMSRPGDGGGNIGGIPVIPSHTGHEAVRLDDMGFQGVGILKLDVEGWEPNALEGAKKLIQEQNPIVAVEFNKVALDNAGFVYDDIAKHFAGWKGEEIWRYGEGQWDMVFYR